MKKIKIPHTYVIIFYIILFCAALTWVIPGGKYVETIQGDGVKTLVYEPVERVPQSWQVFSAFYKGFVDRADIIVFILIIGGAFWIVNDSKAFDIGTAGFLKKARTFESNFLIRKMGVENFLLTSIMLLFSIFGAVFGMSEETIAFCLVLVPMAISMGYDSITGVCMVFVAAGLGFAGAILNPFTIGIAQGLAGLPLFSGIEYRIFCWVVINAAGFTWILRYAAKVKKNPQLSPVYEEDQYWRDLHTNQDAEIRYYTPKAAWYTFTGLTVVLLLFSFLYPQTTLTIGNSQMEGLPLIPLITVLFMITSFFTLRKTVHLYILNLLFFTIFFLIIGVMGYDWYIMEIATLFFALGMVAGLANDRTPDELVKLFMDGCKDILGAALVVGLAGGIIVILQDAHVIDTILFRLSKGMEELGQVATVGMMYLIQNLINLVIPSGSAKAALTMPIMAPFSDLIGLSKQATVMAFQFGDGFTNMITPTSGVLIAVLGVSRIPYEIWLRWIWKFMVVLIILGFLLLIPTVLIPMNGF
ncbi:MAG: AbgT family transporter [Tannerellaceae bacterium]|nr:AbgT family transporter [Tannerellaceae bacterium]